MPVLRQQLSLAAAEPFELVFVDDKPPAAELNGQRILTYAQWLEAPLTTRKIAIAIADGRVRELIARRCDADDIGIVDVKAQNVVSLDDVRIGEGAVLCPFVTLTSNIRIGRHFHANIYSYVEHDCIIGDFVTFAPGVHCNGNVRIEDHAYIGAGAMIRQGRPGAPLVIGRGAVVGMGAVVTRDVPDGATVVGNPARAIERKT